MSFSIFIFIYTIHLAYLKVNTKFENTAPIGAEKSLTEKKRLQTDRRTDIVKEKAKTIYPLYTSYTGGIIKQTHFILTAKSCRLISMYRFFFFFESVSGIRRKDGQPFGYWPVNCILTEITWIETYLDIFVDVQNENVVYLH